MYVYFFVCVYISVCVCVCVCVCKRVRIPYTEETDPMVNNNKIYTSPIIPVTNAVCEHLHS